MLPELMRTDALNAVRSLIEQNVVEKALSHQRVRDAEFPARLAR
jgi:hypothetical protein